VLPPFEELYELFCRSDETLQIEAKKSQQEISQSLLTTISAFSNEPGCGGGYLLLGVSRTIVDGNNRYEISGLANPDKIQNDLANQCAGSFNITIRPEIGVHVLRDGKRVLCAHIPEADPSEKPVYFKKGGIEKGAFRRIGSADVRCTDVDLAMLYNLRGSAGFDDGIVRGATLSDIDRTAVKEYRRTRGELNPLAEELRLNMPDLLTSIGALQRTKSRELAVTRAGLLLFGKPSALRRFMPTARIDYIIVAGQQWVPDDANRYRAVEIRQPLLLAIPKIIDLVVQDLPTTFQLKGKRSRRKEVPAIPHAVIREAIVNAVMHRNYRVHSQIQIRRFSNRVEIGNPGYSLIPSDRLGQPGSHSRNPRIADVLHDSGYAETKGTGIRVMRQQMHDANMSEPLFKSSRDEDRFQVTLLTHHLMDAATVEWLSALAGPYGLTDHDAKALAIAKETGFIDNATFRNINAVDVLTASKALQRLRDAGLLHPHNRGAATFYTATEAMLKPALNPLVKAPLKRGFKGKTKSQPLPLSDELVGLLRKMGERSSTPRLIEVAILRLCAIRPLTVRELSKYLKRGPSYLQSKFITRLIKSKALTYLYPDNPAHPGQAYVTAPVFAELPIPMDRPRPIRKKGKQGRLEF
jgi:ATP-dependent DNA helicase RecG